MYSVSNSLAKNHQNQLMWVDVILCNISVIFWRHSVYGIICCYLKEVATVMVVTAQIATEHWLFSGIRQMVPRCTPSNTWVYASLPIISVSSAIFTGFIVMTETHRQTDRHTEQAVLRLWRITITHPFCTQFGLFKAFKPLPIYWVLTCPFCHLATAHTSDASLCV